MVKNNIHLSAVWVLPMMIGMCLLALLVSVQPAAAITKIPDPTPEPGSYGLEATKPQPAPTQGATVTTPGSGGAFTNSPTTVTGICPDGLLVQVYDNNVMVGSVMCTNGSFSLQVTLFAGANDLSATVFDDLGQAGPNSNTNSVTYTNAQFTSFGQLVTLTSSYGRRSANAGSELTWPLQLSGGTGPYAFSIDWGDGSPSELRSQALSGVVPIAHTYNKAGIYQVNIKVSDANGVSAFLQMIAVANGKADTTPTSGSTSGNGSTPAKILWEPAAVSIVLLIPAYWLGRRSELVSLHTKMLKDRDRYEEKP